MGILLLEVCVQKSSAKIVVISKEFAGQRLDNYLFREFRKVPKSRVYKMLRKGEVRVNGSRKKQAYRIEEGDKIRLPPIHLVESDESKEGVFIPEGVKRQLSENILHEDEHLLVLAKPPKLAVHSGSGVDYGVIEVLREMRPEAAFLELAHRLDRETSGCLLLAKSRKTLVQLHELLRNGGVDKHYRVLVAGKWQGGARKVDSTLARLGERGKVRRTVQDNEGKEASSLFTPLEYFDGATLMDVKIFTGRTHQIRVQSADLGHPVLGDDKYGDFPLNRQWKKKGLKRMFLHSYEVWFTLPGSLEKQHYLAPLPADLQSVLDRLT